MESNKPVVKSIPWYLTQILILEFTNGLFAQETVKIQRLTEPVTFDGVPTEEAWLSLDQFPLTMHRPNFGNQPSEASGSLAMAPACPGTFLLNTISSWIISEARL